MACSVRWAVAVVAVGFCCCATEGQITSFKQVDGKTISCTRSGLGSNQNDCGTQSDWYPYVFVGTISAITPTKDDEKELQIVPDEIFKGQPTNPLIIRTSGGACFPELTLGDHWLFYLRSGNPIVLDFYGNISRPVADSQERLETLRRLKTIGDNGILRGRVLRGPFGDGEPISDAQVIARRATDDAQFVATSDADGRYEFQPLPPGKYKLIVDDPKKSFRADEATLEVKSQQCWDYTPWKTPHGHLGGHVRRSDGSPVPWLPILITDEKGSWFETIISDAQGYFHREVLSSGKYLVGINLPGQPTWRPSGCVGTPGACSIPKASLYYPGMRNRADALLVSLADDEKRDDVDFIIPAQ